MTKMDNQETSLFTPSGCLTASALEGLALKTLSGKVLLQAKAHIESCELCADSFEGVKLWLEKTAMKAGGAPSTPGGFTRRTGELNEKVKKQLLGQKSSLSGGKIRRLPGRAAWVAIAASLVLFIGLYFLFLSHPFMKQGSLALEKNIYSEKENALQNSIADSQSSRPVLGLSKPKAMDEARRKEKLPEPAMFSQDDLSIKNEDNAGKIPSTLQFTPPVIKADEDVKDLEMKKPLHDQDAVEIVVEADEANASGVASSQDMLKMNKSTSNIAKREALQEEEMTRAYTVVEQMPEYPGGEEKMLKFLRENIKYPESARNNGIEGTVYLTFVVNSNGKINDVKLLRGIGGGCDEEALRLVRLMPKWVPGKQNGKNVPVQFNLPIKFRLSDK
jgi:periplasmic protein TonB